MRICPASPPNGLSAELEGRCRLNQLRAILLESPDFPYGPDGQGALDDPDLGPVGPYHFIVFRLALMASGVTSASTALTLVAGGQSSSSSSNHLAILPGLTFVIAFGSFRIEKELPPD